MGAGRRRPLDFRSGRDFLAAGRRRGHLGGHRGDAGRRPGRDERTLAGAVDLRGAILARRTAVLARRGGILARRGGAALAGRIDPAATAAGVTSLVAVPDVLL